jgi:hypothetical protein
MTPSQFQELNMRFPRMVEEPYHIPAGYTDFPFCYVFDASILTDGTTAQNLVVPTQGDSDFIIRHIIGLPQCVSNAPPLGRWGLHNPNSTLANGNPSTGILAYGQNNWTVLPEKRYRPNEQIKFDLYNVSRQSTVTAQGTIYFSQLGFFGVKRYAPSAAYPLLKTAYKYWELIRTFNFGFTVTQGYFGANGGVNPTTTYWQQTEYDFELLGISINNASGLFPNGIAITPYTPNRQYRMSNLPLQASWINYTGSPINVGQGVQGVFPVPSMIYPANSLIEFDVTSLLPLASAPQTYSVDFVGIWRIPCR